MKTFHFDSKRDAGCFVRFEQVILPDLHGEDGEQGLLCRAHVSMIDENRVGTVFTIDSPGLWGIDGLDEDYAAQIYAEERAELVAMLNRLTGWQDNGDMPDTN
jgi:hypothetical protein